MTKTAEEKIRCTAEEREAWTLAAREQNVSRAEFIRRAANAAAQSRVYPDGETFLASFGTPNVSVRDEEHLGRACQHGRAPGRYCPVCDK